jgi:hypothetical protein
VTHANRRGVEFRSLRIETRGDYDLPAYLGIDRSIPPGFLNISYTVEDARWVEPDASFRSWNCPRRATPRVVE